MYRLARYDVARRFGEPWVRLGARIAFGLLCTAVMLTLIIVVQLWTPLVGPFLFLFPTVVIATLYGHWPAGVACMLSSLAAVGHFILPGTAAFSFVQNSVGSRIFTAGLVASTLLVFAESFRLTVARHVAERDREIDRREILLRELEHRTRNNFALVASLLDFQRRQSKDPEVKHALEHAASRVHTFADAYSQLAMSQTETSDVEMHPYLTRLLERVSHALFGEGIAVESDIAPLALPSRKAVAIGLYVNEALTNCAKYAFPEGRDGTVKVALSGVENGGWRLTVLDDGVGVGGNEPPPEGMKSSGLGAMLFDALAAQAGAKHQVTLPPKGRRLDLVSLS